MVSSILEKMKEIDYGWVDKKGSIHKEDEAYDFLENYILQTPEEIEKNKIGVCWDQVEYERKIFDKNRIINETYFIYINDNKLLPSHSFLVYYLNGKVYWFEHSWHDQKGIHEYNNIKELLNNIKILFYRSREKEVEANLEVCIYKYNKPKYHITCEKFYNYIYTQEKINIENIK